jgi:hypothetical protein
MNRTIFAAGLLLIAASVDAQETFLDVMQRCASIEDGGNRLNCFDTLSRNRDLVTWTSNLSFMLCIQKRHDDVRTECFDAVASKQLEGLAYEQEHRDRQSERQKLLATIAAAPPGSATARSAVFGMLIGQPLEFPECSYFRISQESLMYRTPSQMAELPCFQHTIGYEPGDPLDRSVETVKVFIEKPPRGVLFEKIRVLLLQGRVESVSIRTQGLLQTDVAEMLREKYGEPHQSTVEKVQNRMSAEYESLSHSWQFDDLSVSFAGLAGTVDEGMIVIDSPAAIEHRRRQREQEKATETRL